MLGEALKLSINAENITQTQTDFYFPKGSWCRLSGNTSNETCFNATNGMNKTYPSDLSDYQLHLREGFIVPMQDTTTIKFNTTKDLQAHPVDFHVHGSLSASGDGTWTAQGRYINDDGVNLDLNGTVNSYTLLSQYDGKDTITVRVGMDQKATKF